MYFKYGENNLDEDNEEFHFLLFILEILSLEKIFFIAWRALQLGIYWKCLHLTLSVFHLWNSSIQVQSVSISVRGGLLLSQNNKIKQQK